MFSKLKFWLECSRWYALPMSVFSWFVVFSYALQHDGNALYGFIALVGICFSHLATNLFDDFCDFNILQKNIDHNNNLILPNTQRGKCKYILDGKVKLSEVLLTVGIYCFISLLIGLFFYFAVGKTVLWFILGGGLIVLFYSLLSNICLSELAVGLVFGPLMFGGVYYVMTGKLTPEVFALSVAPMLFTVNLLFTDTFLDKDIDKKEGKRTLVSLFKTDENVLNFQKGLLTVAYLSVLLIPIFDISDWEVFFVFLTVPLASDLINSLKLYSEDKSVIPDKKWFHFPFEEWDDIKENRSQTFMFRMYQARNLMIYFAGILSLTLWFGG